MLPGMRISIRISERLRSVLNNIEQKSRVKPHGDIVYSCYGGQKVHKPQGLHNNVENFFKQRSYVTVMMCVIDYTCAGY